MTPRKKIALAVLGGLLLVFLLIQLVPVERSNPTGGARIAWDSPRTEALARRACMDCHSNETVWPGYSRVAPVSWFVANHVNEGRREMNFSTGHDVEIDECSREMQRGKMPMASYIWLHPEAKLSATEQQELLAGLRRTFAGARGGEGGSGEGRERRGDHHDDD